MEFKPLYYKGGLERKIINPYGNTGILTLWTKPKNMEEGLRNNFPELFNKKSSPLVAITNFYGNGLPQLLANLAYNPQISKIVLAGRDTPAVPSSNYLLNFLKRGTIKNNEEYGMSRIRGTSYYIDSQLTPELFSHIGLKRFEKNDHKSIYNFIMENSKKVKKDRIKINLREPDFDDFPSNLITHQIAEITPLEAWKEIMYKLERFGKNVSIPKGKSFKKRRMLLDVNTSIEDPSFEGEDKLRKFGFDPCSLKKYQEDILKKDLPDGTEYSYGNRLRNYWKGKDTLENVGNMLRENPESRFAFISLWDSYNDLVKRDASPCLTDIYFVKHPIDKKLVTMASFRTHNSTSAWLYNIYGLRSIQEYVSSISGIEPGQINVRSRYLSMDPDDSQTLRALNIIHKNRKSSIDLKDPKGNYSVEVNKKEQQIILNHYSQKGTLLEKIRGKDMYEVKGKLRDMEGVSSYDHAMWLGMELAKAQRRLYSKNE